MPEAARAVSLALLVLLLVAAVAQSAHEAAERGEILACVRDGTGAMRAVHSFAECRAGEHPLAWDVRGPASHELLVGRTGGGGGVVTSSPLGISCGAICFASFDRGATVTLHATPEAGSRFLGWSGHCTGTGRCAVLLDAARTVMASFATTRAPLAVAVEGPGNVASIPSGIYCGPICETTFDEGARLTLVATPEGGGRFTGWGGACAGTARDCVVTMSEARSVSASFAPRLHPRLVVTALGPGTVTSSPLGISCGSVCSASFDEGARVTLVATPGAGAVFDGWSGACTGGGACEVLMDAHHDVAARFLRSDHGLAVTVRGNGTVTSAPLGIYCGVACSYAYPASTMVTLTAHPAAGTPFAGWSGACSGTERTCIVTMDAGRAVEARFGGGSLLVQKARLGSGEPFDGGSVASEPAGILCGEGCAQAVASFKPGTQVLLRAAATATHRPAAWSGCTVVAGDKTQCSVEMTSDAVVVVYFEPI